MTNWDVIKLCEDEAIQYYKEYGIDISTKEKRIALDEQTKKEIFDVLVQMFFEHSLSF